MKHRQNKCPSQRFTVWHWLAVCDILYYVFVSACSYIRCSYFGCLFLKCFKCQSENERLSEKPKAHTHSLSTTRPDNQLQFFFLQCAALAHCWRTLLSKRFCRFVFKYTIFFISKTPDKWLCLREYFGMSSLISYENSTNWSFFESYRLQCLFHELQSLPFKITTANYANGNIFIFYFGLILSWKFSGRFACKQIDYFEMFT